MTKHALKKNLDDEVIDSIRQLMEPDPSPPPAEKPPFDWKEYDARVEAQVALDLANPDPARSANRWKRIKELHEQWTAGFANDPVKIGGRRKKGAVPWYETPEGDAVATEMKWLCSLERETAAQLDWPVWQERQHFHWLTPKGIVRCGEVLALDLWLGLVECRVWDEDDFAGSLGMKKEFTVVSTGMIVAGEREHDKLEAARQKAWKETREHEENEKRLAKSGKTGQKSLFDAIPSAD